MTKTDEPLGVLETVATFEEPMPAGVTVSHTGRIFVSFPRWGDDVPATAGEMRDGDVRPYPDQRWNQPRSDADETAFVSAQSVVVDPADQLWVLDTGSPMFQPTRTGGPKLVCVDLSTNAVIRTIVLPSDVALPTTYLDDVRFDLRRGEAGMAFITDASLPGPNGIIVVDLATGQAWRRLHDHPSTKAEPPTEFRPVVEGRYLMQRPPGEAARPFTAGSDGIALSADGTRLYYCPLASRKLYSVSVDALCDRSRDDASVAATVVDEGDKGTGSGGLESDTDGNLYLSAYEHNAVLRRTPDGQYGTVVHDPRLLWPDTLSLADDGYLYIIANQLHRQPVFHEGRDLRVPPYALFRVRVDAAPVRLRG